MGSPTADKAHGRVQLPLRIRWSGHPKAYDLNLRADRIRVYEQVLREGTEHDIRHYIDLDELVELWNDLVLRTHVRQAWAQWFKTHHPLDPIRTPVANAFAERWIGTLRRELLDRTLIWNRRQLKRLVVDYIDHYNTHRPHRSLDQLPPAGGLAEQPLDRPLQVVRSTRCGGLIHKYRKAA
jgi:hypothetical protein